MRKRSLILDLLNILRNRSQSKAETKVEVNVEQKIDVVIVNIDRDINH